MSDQIHQMQVRHDVIEDRLLLRILTRQHKEFRVWLTRRFTARMLQALGSDLARPGEPKAAPTQATEAVRAFREEAAIAKSDFASKYSEEASEFPLGEAGILAASMQLTRLDANRVRVVMSPKEGEGLNLVMPTDLLVGARKLVIDGATKAEWGLDIARPGDGDAPATVN